LVLKSGARWQSPPAAARRLSSLSEATFP
jgi:hypothetical protein